MTPRRTMQPGEAASQIDLQYLQEGLTSLGFLQRRHHRGDYGPACRQAVLYFQRSRGLLETAIVDEATWAQLDADLVALGPIGGPA